MLLLAICPALAQTGPLFGFEPNTGQFPPAVLFARRSSDRMVYLTRDAIVLPSRIRIQIAGVDPSVTPVGDAPLATVYNFLPGDDPSRLRTNVRLFGAVRLNNIYPGISAAFMTGTQPIELVSPDEAKITLSIAREPI